MPSRFFFGSPAVLGGVLVITPLLLLAVWLFNRRAARQPVSPKAGTLFVLALVLGGVALLVILEHFLG